MIAPEVALVFPPLVETNFGSYYPSTAVLSGYLAASGINSIQADLNEDFAVYLLVPGSLKNSAEGVFGHKLTYAPSSMPSVAARILIRYGKSLLDLQGRHLFRDDSSEIAYLLSILAQAYRIDVPLSVINSPEFYDSPKAVAYRDFFGYTKYAETLPDSIHTVGISISVGPQLAPALILARYLKAIRPDIAVILGGPTISLMAITDIEKMLLHNSSVDASIRYEGEHPFEILIKQRRDGNWKPEKIPGISCRAKGGIIHQPPETGLALDSIPYAEYDYRLLSRLAQPEIGIIQSRGCYWGKCTYCDYVELYKYSPRYRTRTPDSFVDEMEYQTKKHGRYKFSVITEAISPIVAERISNLILERDLHVKWHSFAMIDRHFTPAVFEKMVRAGCEYLVVGVETMTDRVLHLMKKAATKETTVEFILNAKASGLDLKINLIPNLPTTTYQEAMESLAMIQRFEEYFTYVSSFPFEATRSSAVGKEPGHFGLCVVESESTTGQAQFTLNHLEVSDPAMTASELEQVYSDYHAFAAQVNNRGIMDTSPTVIKENSLDDLHFQLAKDFLDITKVDGEIQCYNWLTRKRFQIPQEWTALIEKMRSEQPFRRKDFIQLFSTISSGEFYFNRLLENGILTIHEPSNRE